MSNRLFQGIVHQMRESIDRVIGVVDSYAVTIACSDLTRIGETNEYLVLDLNENTDIFVRDGYTYKPFGTRTKPDYAVFVEGTDETAAKFCNILAISFASIKQYYDEKYDRNNFIKNVILENILPGDIYVKARELHFNTDVNRVVLLVRVVSSNDISAFDVIQNLFPDKQKDFVFNISEKDIVLVKEIKSGINGKDIEKLARSIVDTLVSGYRYLPGSIRNYLQSSGRCYYGNQILYRNRTDAASICSWCSGYFYRSWLYLLQSVILWMRNCVYRTFCTGIPVPAARC